MLIIRMLLGVSLCFVFVVIMIIMAMVLRIVSSMSVFTQVLELFDVLNLFSRHESLWSIPNSGKVFGPRLDIQLGEHAVAVW